MTRAFLLKILREKEVKTKVYVYRYKHPYIERRYRTPGSPWERIDMVG